VTERHFSQRYDAAPLKLELYQRSWLGQWQAPHHAMALEITLGGVSILSPLKLRIGQHLLISLGNRHHSLQQVTAEVIQKSPQGRDFLYGLKFDFSRQSDNSRQSAETLLKLILNNLTH
jgi:hypothetical protein